MQKGEVIDTDQNIFGAILMWRSVGTAAVFSTSAWSSNMHVNLAAFHSLLYSFIFPIIFPQTITSLNLLIHLRYHRHCWVFN